MRASVCIVFESGYGATKEIRLDFLGGLGTYLRFGGGQFEVFSVESEHFQLQIAIFLYHFIVNY